MGPLNLALLSGKLLRSAHNVISCALKLRLDIRKLAPELSEFCCG